MRIIKGLVVLFLVVVLGQNTNAQEERAVQVTFIYPIGTAGVDAVNFSNKFSLNIMGGVNGGVNGVELGYVYNINRGDVTGCQIAGVFNQCSENSNGAIISGVTNIIAGESRGATIAGVTNVVKGESRGAIISGVANISDSHKGLQLSTVNVVSEKFNGAQIGVVNIARKAKGFQLGVVNVCDSGDSIVPLGIVNVIKNGYYAFELSTNEVLLTNLSFKMGTEKFHSIFRGGIGRFKGKSVFSTGLGFGSIIPIGGSRKMNLELICDDLHYDGKWNKLNLLGQFKLSYQYRLSDCLEINAGPSIRTYVTNQKVDGKFDVIDVPYTIFEHTGSKVKTSGWIGLNVGIVMSL